jgi:hypothetical protein
MTKRKALMLLDSSMLLSFLVLMAWRLSGITAHEWIGLATIALILSHLIVHWGWVESSITRVVKRQRGGRLVALLLNAALFVSMGTALISGVVISKVVLPNNLLPGDYLQWHGLHNATASIAVVVVGLHIALNWDRIRGGFRHLLTASRRPPNRVTRAWRLSSGVVLRQSASVLALSGLLIVAVWGMTRIFPSHPRVLMRFPDGHTALVAPPAAIARVRTGTTSPHPSQGGGAFLGTLAAVSITAVIGRRVLKLRLNG